MPARGLACLLLLLLSAMPGNLRLRSAFLPHDAIAASLREIQVTARKYHYTPNPIRVRQGEHAVLVVTSLDRAHGFSIPSLGVNVMLPRGRPVQIPIPTDHPGIYRIRCSHFCGLFHFWMTGKLIIAPAAPAQATAHP